MHIAHIHKFTSIATTWFWCVWCVCVFWPLTHWLIIFRGRNAFFSLSSRLSPGIFYTRTRTRETINNENAISPMCIVHVYTAPDSSNDARTNEFLSWLQCAVIAIRRGSVRRSNNMYPVYVQRWCCAMVHPNQCITGIRTPTHSFAVHCESAGARSLRNVARSLLLYCGCIRRHHRGKCIYTVYT